MTDTAAFHRQLYAAQKAEGWLGQSWFGIPIAKCPFDLFVYQELLVETKPDVIVETGSWYGGSALYLAHLCDLLRHGHIVSIDVASVPRTYHPRILYVTASSIDEETLDWVRAHTRGKRVMVILDSDHSKRHVLAELKAYAPLVAGGCYLIVEDSNVNGHPVEEKHGPGPWEALEEWLPDHDEFTVDREREKFMVSFNPGGYLRRRE